jgi:hypothetical protein
MSLRPALKWLALVGLCFLPVATSGQERIHQVKVGPYGDEIRIIDAVIEPAPEGYKMQSMIIDVKPAKSKKEPPQSVQVDLTSTVRSLKTGKKEQQILVLRWKATGELEFKCDGKWVKQDASTAATIIETVKAVIENVPLDAKTPTEVTLPQEIEQRVSAALDGLGSKDLPCVRDVH